MDTYTYTYLPTNNRARLKQYKNTHCYFDMLHRKNSMNITAAVTCCRKKHDGQHAWNKQVSSLK